MPKPAKWGRTETIIWPPRSPIYTYGAIFLACIAASLFVYLRFTFALTPLQQFYLPYYLRTEVAVDIVILKNSAHFRKSADRSIGQEKRLRKFKHVDRSAVFVDAVLF